MTASASIFGIIGIGIGWWWADAAAALIISADIVHDGYTNLKQAVFDLMDQVPKTVNNQETDPLVDKIKETLSRQNWIKDFNIRLREEGHIYLGEGFVICNQEENLTQLIENTASEVEKLSWRIQEFIIMPVNKLPQKEKA